MPGVKAGIDGYTACSSLISYLEVNDSGSFYLVAVSSANEASSIVLDTGKPVLAMGGFTGSDPAMTVEKLQKLVAGKQVRYILIGGGQGGGQGGGSNNAIIPWVEANGTVVDASAYEGGSGSSFGFGGGTLYDLASSASR